MPLLRMRQASFRAPGCTVGPVSVDLHPGQHAALIFESAHEAEIAALLAAGIVKPTTGCVLVDEYDSRVQPVHCKRIAAFVPHDPLPPGASEFGRYIAYRAALWNVETARAIAHAKLLLERLEDMHEAFAYPLVGALIASPRLVVLDRPQPVYAAAIMRAVGPSALLSMHAGDAAAAAFFPSAHRRALEIV